MTNYISIFRVNLIKFNTGIECVLSLFFTDFNRGLETEFYVHLAKYNPHLQVLHSSDAYDIIDD